MIHLIPNNGNKSALTHGSDNESIARIPTQDTLDILLIIVINLNVDYNLFNPSQPSPNFKKNQSIRLKITKLSAHHSHSNITNSGSSK